MKNQMLRILKVEPGKPPYEKEIKDKLEDIQAEGGGLFEIVYLSSGVLLCCNEEGKLNGMKPNRTVGDDIICGPFFLVGDSQDGEFVSLQGSKIVELTKQFAQPEQFTGQEPGLQPRMQFFTFG